MSLCCYFGGFFAFLVSLHIIRTILTWLYENIIGPEILGPKININKMGKWALVTGPTSGIGKAYAKQLAQNGLNIILVGRSIDKLEDVSKELEKNYKIETKIIIADFSKGIEVYDRIKNSLAGYDIGVLVNNIGISLSYPEYFTEIPNQEQFLQDIVSCNIYSVLFMCSIILPDMVLKRKGLIINLSSMAAIIPNPLLSAYSGSKAFIDKFSEDLSTEYSDKGIFVQSVLPGYVSTRMSKMKPSLFSPSPEKYVYSALKTIGYSRHTTGYIPHAFFLLALTILSKFISIDLANKIAFNQLLSLRNRAIKRNKDKSLH